MSQIRLQVLGLVFGLISWLEEFQFLIASRSGFGSFIGGLILFLVVCLIRGPFFVNILAVDYIALCLGLCESLWLNEYVKLYMLLAKGANVAYWAKIKSHKDWFRSKLEECKAVSSLSRMQSLLGSLPVVMFFKLLFFSAFMVL